MKKLYTNSLRKRSVQYLSYFLFFFALAFANGLEAQTYYFNTDGTTTSSQGNGGATTGTQSTAASQSQTVGSIITVPGPFCDGCDDPSGGSSLACSGGRNAIIQGIDISGMGGMFLVNSINFNQESFRNNTQNMQVTVNVFCGTVGTVPYTPNNAPLHSESFILSGANDGACVNLAFTAPPTIDATSCTTLWIEFVTTGGQRSVSTPVNCNGTAATGNLSYIRAPNCGVNTPTLFRNVGSGFMLDASFAVNLEPIAVPTLGQWGLIILSLLMMSIVMVFSTAPKMATANGQTIPTKVTLQNFAFDKNTFFAAWTGVALVTVLGFVTAMNVFGYELTSADPMGAFVASGIVAYMITKMKK